MDLLKAIQQARWVPAAMSIANGPQIYHKTGRDHGCETIAGKNNIAPELLECASTGTVMTSVILILPGRFEGNEGGLLAAGGKIDTRTWLK